jgi:hypothetical protein
MNPSEDQIRKITKFLIEKSYYEDLRMAVKEIAESKLFSFVDLLTKHRTPDTLQGHTSESKLWLMEINSTLATFAGRQTFVGEASKI